MELKRYVLMNNNVVCDLTVDRDIRKYNMVKNGAQNVYGVKKTSDNILDLVEVGDLVAYKINNNSENTVKVLFESPQKYDGWDNWCWKKEVTAIYKKQPNGDYKRYEVKE